MQRFRYGYFDNLNRPPPIQPKHMQNGHMSATAAQKLCFFRLFPIMFNDFINDVPSIILYRQLRDIMDLVLSVPFRKQWLPVLQDLCVAFHESMSLYFPTKMVPKIHFACEYDQVINHYGPAKRQWCLRYEGCHAYFKKIAIRSNNFKNVPKSLATRYSLKQTYRISLLAQPSNLNYAVGINTISQNSFTAPIKSILLAHFGNIDLEKDIMQCRKLFYENIEYCQSSVYILNLRELDEQPAFGQIAFILKTNEKWWLLVDKLKTVGYNEKLCAWEIKSMDCFSIDDPCDLKYFHKGLDVYILNNMSFVSFTCRLTLY